MKKNSVSIYRKEKEDDKIQKKTHPKKKRRPALRRVGGRSGTYCSRCRRYVRNRHHNPVTCKAAFLPNGDKINYTVSLKRRLRDGGNI